MSTPLPANAVLLPNNLKNGFWGACTKSGWAAVRLWLVASDYLAERFQLNPEQVRDLLDGEFGADLAADFKFIPAGTGSIADVREHLVGRFASEFWNAWMRKNNRIAV